MNREEKLLKEKITVTYEELSDLIFEVIREQREMDELYNQKNYEEAKKHNPYSIVLNPFFWNKKREVK